MALSHLLRYIYNNGTDEVIRRGKKIHGIGAVEMTDHDDLMHNISFRVRDDVYHMFYKVYVNKFHDPNLMQVRCSCPYNLSELCRHEVAALLRLQDIIDKNLLQSSALTFDQRFTVAKMKFIDLKMLKMLSSPALFREAESILRTTKANILSAENDLVKAELHLGASMYPLSIQRNSEQTFDTSCLCNENAHPLCEHKVVLFLQLLNNYGAYYFDSIRNRDKEKEKLLQLYGYSLKDNLEGKFEFVYKEGKPFLKVIDPDIKRVAAASTPATPSPAPLTRAAATAPVIKEAEVAEEQVFPVINFRQAAYPYIGVDLVKAGEDFAPGDRLEKLDLGKYVNVDNFSEDSRQLFQQVRKVQDAEVKKYLNRNSPFSGIWDNIIQSADEELTDETKLLIIEYMYPKLQRILENAASVFVLPKGKKFVTASLETVNISDEEMTPYLVVGREDDEFTISVHAKAGSREITFSENKAQTDWLYFDDGTFILWPNSETLKQVTEMKQLPQKVSFEDWPQFMQKHIIPLAEKNLVVFEKGIVQEERGLEPEARLMLQENGAYLNFVPVFTYNGWDVQGGDAAAITRFEEGVIKIIHRNEKAETAFTDKIKSLHTDFVQHSGGVLALKGDEVLRHNWFFSFMDNMKTAGVPVFGFEHLRNYRFNQSKPSTRIHLTSGMDWFDARVDLEFGGVKANIADVKQALASRQNFVALSDGTLGVLPEEWIKKYSLLFKVGEQGKNNLKLSKYHLGIIDDLYENRDEEEISFQLDEKLERIRDFKSLPELPPPAELNATLRPYQLGGYNWLTYLNQVGWGGILADDMGLGKTIQALTMLLGYTESNENLRSPVACPTTLIYNWQNELQKFAPGLSYVVHHGNQRSRDPDFLTRHNVIITTYGTLRSDIQMFLKIRFDYVILDESQAIKNPSSKVAKAAALLSAANRVCMSGTPLQNNTFDIYSQMNFLNPGLLGSMEFFRNEFATPIDKFGEKTQKEHLRKLLYPFILRRTKEQVAKDLPEKTETTLFCEMTAEQRQIYDAYRNSYRDNILNAIEEHGLEKSQFTILQGLMKLRQICDSPAILNEEEKFGNHSVKLRELERELTENMGNHKALIFSQFLGMLALIRSKLDELKIPYVYFDGNTSAIERERAINEFQNNENVRVFLISLKAGGVGLNLTAADYVYLVDPWWNPAVEQQAIDRTHRIGQTKNIFAYRMICVDTIEDKIQQLQEKKRSLARELIADDAQFVKSLTRADIEYLLS